MKPTEDKVLFDIIHSIEFSEPTVYESTEVANHILTELEKLGYQRHDVKSGISHIHIYDNETPNRLYTHSHSRGDIPHGHHGSRYWKVEKDGKND